MKELPIIETLLIINKLKNIWLILKPSSRAFHRAQTLKSARLQNLKEYNYHHTHVLSFWIKKKSDKLKIHHVRQIKNYLI